MNYREYEALFTGEEWVEISDNSSEHPAAYIRAKKSACFNTDYR